jgi:endonuclease YncB( thermonuclease family)
LEDLPPESESENKLVDAMKKLEVIYTLNSSFAYYKIQDAIVGYGIAGDSLVVDVLAKYYESDLILIKQKIQDIVGHEVNIVFSPSGAIVPTNFECYGNARCFSGKVTKIIDGDTIKVMDESEESIRFALASAPEISDVDGIQARDHIASICPVGSIAIVDEDDKQIEGSYGRVIAQIHCNGISLNEELLESGLGKISTEFCSKSEFAFEPWAIKFGC